MHRLFELHSEFSPAGDQPEAIDALVASLQAGIREQTLQGVTGSGKTFTLANVIERVQKPVLLISHNKTLAGQLYSEFKHFFPQNAIEFFISYYDYYLPEAYIPQTDTYIAKDAHINEEIEKLRLAATSSLMERQDVFIVASVSCIYGLGSPEDFSRMSILVNRGDLLPRQDLLKQLVTLQYERNDVAPSRSCFRAAGDCVDVFPAYRDDLVRLEFWGDEVERITWRDPLTLKISSEAETVSIFPARHFVMPQERVKQAEREIREELGAQVHAFEKAGRLVEAQRIYQRTMYDLEMMHEVGYCSGIENYSRHLSGRPPGALPYTLLDYFPDGFITIIDESHVTLPQIRAMYNADRSRKMTLVDHGFRLPSALDNRPLSFDEFLEKVGQLVFVSATPGPFEQERTRPILQEIRPTGLLDPEIIVRPLKDQIDDLIAEVRAGVEKGERTLVTTLTKRTAEDLADYLGELDIKVQYLHSEIDAIARIEILRELRSGDFDCLIGVNLLREGLDLPEVALVAILDADKEGFLRSETALMQTAGRAARNLRGRVILYADTLTQAIQNVLKTTTRRRQHQQIYNQQHQITPRTVTRSIQESLRFYDEPVKREPAALGEDPAVYDAEALITELEREMLKAATDLEFERAAMLRDQVAALREGDGLPAAGGKKKYPAKRRRARR